MPAPTVDRIARCDLCLGSLSRRTTDDGLRRLCRFGIRRGNFACTLSPGYIAPVLANILTPALRAFERTHGETELKLKEMTPEDQVKSLRDGSIDLALLGNPCPELASEFEITVLRRIALHAVLPDNHLLAKRNRLGLAELKDETFIGFVEAFR